ncbi:DUF1836 domain-containing protein [Clostridium fermenticellae]|uniref:DUF1836 domain-containing protein n=1 Tax=Clostridium fermenticellae TaxID=2068654 RepID=A0A386H4I2_9CLOT|nr:DUF1836 domain-containing protein [Clostridium fermenticellae]AYD40544.1 DUF1836 domain-containing protein [Clostridium fermenticellae]
MGDIKKNVLESIEELNLNQEIELSDIPKLDLYMDQVITLFETSLSGTKRSEEDKLLTKTMINNYTKDKILMPIKNKKYSRNHIIMMIFLYNLKQILSINDIKLLLNKIVVNSKEEENMKLDSLYQVFLNIKKADEVSLKEEIENKVNSILKESEKLDRSDDYEKLLLVVLTLINNANMQRRTAEKIIDKYFK